MATQKTNAAGQHACNHDVGGSDPITNSIANGMTGQTTAQAAIDALTGAAAATETHVLTRGADGHAGFAEPSGGSMDDSAYLPLYQLYGAF